MPAGLGTQRRGAHLPADEVDGLVGVHQQVGAVDAVQQLPLLRRSVRLGGSDPTGWAGGWLPHPAAPRGRQGQPRGAGGSPCSCGTRTWPCRAAAPRRGRRPGDMGQGQRGLIPHPAHGRGDRDKRLRDKRFPAGYGDHASSKGKPWGHCTVKCSVGGHCTARHEAAQSSAVLHGAVLCCAAWHCVAWHCTAQQSAVVGALHCMARGCTGWCCAAWC